jgi:hypothetical protein
MTSIFNSIKKQLINNEIYGNERKLQFTNFYPENAIVWLTTKQKAFKVTKLNRYIQNGERIYEIEYKDVYTGCDFLDTAYEIAKNKSERADRKGYKSNEPVSVKFLNINDRFRAELDCPNWSNNPDETGYKSCPNNNREFEYISREDSQSFEHFCQWLGYDNYEDFQQYHEFDNEENKQTIDCLYQQFLEGYNIPTWIDETENFCFN